MFDVCCQFWLRLWHVFSRQICPALSVFWLRLQYAYCLCYCRVDDHMLCKTMGRSVNGSILFLCCWYAFYGLPYSRRYCSYFSGYCYTSICCAIFYYSKNSIKKHGRNCKLFMKKTLVQSRFFCSI